MIATYKKPTLSKGLCPLLPPPVLLFRFSFCLLLPTSSLHLKLPSFLTASHDDVTYVIYLTYLQFGILFLFPNLLFTLLLSLPVRYLLYLLSRQSAGCWGRGARRGGCGSVLSPVLPGPQVYRDRRQKDGSFWSGVYFFI